MEFVFIILCPILIAALLSLVFLSIFKTPGASNSIDRELSKAGTKSVLHHNSSYKVADCMERAKKTLDKYDIIVNCSDFVNKY